MCVDIEACMCEYNLCFTCRAAEREGEKQRDEGEDGICLTSISGRRRVEQEVKMDRGFQQSPLSSLYVRESVC